MFVSDFKVSGMYSAYDLARADSDSSSLESAVYIFHQAHLLCESLANDSALSATINESLKLDFVDFHFYVEH